MDTFQIIWMKLPILCAVFLSSPWILYQVWAFIAPGLYKRERRWAAPWVSMGQGPSSTPCATAFRGLRGY